MVDVPLVCVQFVGDVSRAIRVVRVMVGVAGSRESTKPANTANKHYLSSV